jgi:hypothetical protein
MIRGVVHRLFRGERSCGCRGRVRRPPGGIDGALAGIREFSCPGCRPDREAVRVGCGRWAGPPLLTRGKGRRMPVALAAYGSPVCSMRLHPFILQCLESGQVEAVERGFQYLDAVDITGELDDEALAEHGGIFALAVIAVPFFVHQSSV